jgi:hypothetical protein
MKGRNTYGALTVAVVAALLAGCGGEGSSDAAVAAGSAEARAAGGSSAAPRDAYAAKLPIPEEVPDGPGAELGVSMLESAKVPSKSEVGVPAYPGARVMSTMGATAMTVNDERVETLPAMAMLSTDETARVVEFYRGELSGWRHKEFMGSHWFWDGPADHDPMDFTAPYPSVAIMGIDGDDDLALMWPGIRTRIDIKYRSRR